MVWSDVEWCGVVQSGVNVSEWGCEVCGVMWNEWNGVEWWLCRVMWNGVVRSGLEYYE